MANAYLDTSDSGKSGSRTSANLPGSNPPPPIPINKLRAAVRKLRHEKGLSINDCMMRSGLSRTATLDLLNGRGRINCGRLDTWWALAWALDMPMGELMAYLDEAIDKADGLSKS